jgi:hypothetical protein
MRNDVCPRLEAASIVPMVNRGLGGNNGWWRFANTCGSCTRAIPVVGDAIWAAISRRGPYSAPNPPCAGVGAYGFTIHGKIPLIMLAPSSSLFLPRCVRHKTLGAWHWVRAGEVPPRCPLRRRGQPADWGRCPLVVGSALSALDSTLG